MEIAYVEAWKFPFLLSRPIMLWRMLDAKPTTGAPLLVGPKMSTVHTNAADVSATTSVVDAGLTADASGTVLKSEPMTRPREAARMVRECM